MKMGQHSILQLLKKKPMTSKELSQKIGVTPGSVTTCLKRLRKSGDIDIYHPKLGKVTKKDKLRGYKNIIFKLK